MFVFFFFWGILWQATRLLRLIGIRVLLVYAASEMI